MDHHTLFGLDTLRGRLRLFAVALTVLPLLLAAVFFFLFQRGQILDATVAQLVSSLKQERLAIDAWLEERFDDATFLSRLRAVRRDDVSTMATVFQAYVATHTYVSSVTAVEPEGHTHVDTSRPTGVYLGDRPYFSAAQKGHATLVSHLTSRLSGQLASLFVAPVTRPNDQFGGVIILSVALSALDSLVRKNLPSASWTLLLCDADGHILAPSPTDPSDTASAPPRLPTISRALLATGNAGGRYVDAQGQDRLGAVVTLPHGGWRLAGSIAVATVMASYRRQALWIGLGTLATICLVIPIVLRFSRSLEQPLETLTSYARELRETGQTTQCRLVDPKRLPKEIGELFQAFCTMARQVQEHIATAERLSIEDALTGLANRRFLSGGGTKLLESAMRAGQPCACLMLDLDHFKAVNDTYGHQTGDQVLIHLAGILLRCVRKGDLVARYGGEEFAVLLPGADLEQGQRLGERIRQTLATTPCQAGAQTLTVTVSIGVAVARREVQYGRTVLEDLLARADQGLYAAKASGRNRVVPENDGAVPAAS